MTSSIRTRARALALALSFASLTVAGCKLDPKVPEQRHSLNQAELAKNPDLAGDPQAQATLSGALGMLFGTPAEPAYLRVADWIDDGYDPNLGGYDELTADEWDALVADNEVHFVRQLAAIDAGAFDDVARPLYAVDLWRRWEQHLALLEPDGDEPGMQPDDLLDPDDEKYGTWRDEAKRLFTGFYPTMRETADMYRQQCQHCHGVSGGGDGSTAQFLEPRPRDYRPGIFKFTALKDKSHPRRQDLARTLREGIYTTSMPSFARFSEARIQGLVDYVRLLSRRGETEILLANDFEAYSEDVDSSLALEKIRDTYLFVNDRWPTDDEKVIVVEGEVPEPTPESIARGKQLFLGGEGTGANCASCHGVAGLGNGISATEIDPETEKPVLVKDEWGNPIAPRNLTHGIFRFGRRPIDIYRRIYSGINGTPMPAHIGMQITLDDGTKREIDENDIWDLVHYVQYLGTVDIEPAVKLTANAMAAARAGHDDHDHEHGHGPGQHTHDDDETDDHSHDTQSDGAAVGGH
ncbi:MAG: c-type cytochrome [Planctomycetota bacterium]